ncbi:hypothetical protein [Streptomyces sp. NPDC052811]|uniref:hypothetical protein n=1 Tax=Streptomyces sp. NPDC052811 TaxID=3155731 RepID=UPI003437C200
MSDITPPVAGGVDASLDDLDGPVHWRLPGEHRLPLLTLTEVRDAVRLSLLPRIADHDNGDEAYEER